MYNVVKHYLYIEPLQGRTGLMICCYILHRGWAENADEALKHYGQTRTHDTKVS